MKAETWNVAVIIPQNTSPLCHGRNKQTTEFPNILFAILHFLLVFMFID
jgi:hypothetical protein